MQRIGPALLRIATFLLYLVPLVPLVVGTDTFYPFILGKTLLLRTLVELSLVFLLGAFVVGLPEKEKKSIKEKARALLKHPFFLALCLFVSSAVLSTLFALSPYRSFWGTIERGDGLFDLLHYMGFFVLSILLFRGKDWKRFLGIVILEGAVMLAYGIFQKFGIGVFPLSYAERPRVESLVGNAAMFSTYLILLVICAALFFSKKNRVRTWVPVGIIGLSIPLIFTTGTRSAIVGLAAGIVALAVSYTIGKEGRSHPRARLAALILLSACVAGGTTLFVTRNAAVWKEVPGIDRLVATKFLSREDASTETRLLTWSLSMEAWKERPILGWGLENYIFAWEKHYDPRITYYGETWLDKPHNKFVEVMTQQGVIGIISYALVFAALFMTLWKYGGESLRRKAPFVTTGIVAYLVHSTFLFDDVNSYVLLFAIFAICIRVSGEKPEEEIPGQEDKKTSPPFVVKGGMLAALVLLTYSLYVVHFVPYAEARRAKAVREISKAEDIVAGLRAVFQPYNYAQYSLRGNTIDYYYDKHPEVFSDPNLSVLGNALAEYLEEALQKEPYNDARMLIRKNNILDFLAFEDDIFLPASEKVAREALTLMPRRQEIFFLLTRSLTRQGRFEEARQVAEEALALDPRVPRAKANLDFVLALQKEVPPDTAQNIRDIISDRLKAGDFEKVANLVLADARSETPELLPVYYDTALQYFVFQEMEEEFILVAEAVKTRNPGRANDMDIFIDLARKGKWNIIQSIAGQTE